MNGEEKQLTLSWNDYMYQEVETLSELPFGYNDTWDIYASGLEQTVYYYVIGPEAYGVQAIYRGLGEERRSEIAWAEVTGIGADVQPAAATPAYPDVDPSDVGGQIDYGFYTGEEQLSTVSNNAKAETYDVAIKLQNEALVGSHIESITIPMQTKDGISNVSVWLSSQLRVENGKNVPDLVSKSVELTEAGFVTVKLDKPYIIPAEGVYVGYSFTIDDVSVTENQSPVAITNQVNEGGFYMHTSDGFLKWIDATDIYGGSAALTVTVAGKLIKSNAVSMADLPAQYVMTNSEISLPVSVVNHGSEGVKSIDIEYTLAGKTASQHIDVEPAVSGFFGKTATVVVSLPALAESGTYVVDMKVTKVNGVDNEDPNNANGYKIVALNTVPKHRVLLEEYTGLWCGWCPRGFVALEKLASLYPDDYVLVSYHNGDDMEIMASSDFPSNVAGFPSAYIERKTEVDPYYGTTQSTPLGVANDMAAEAEKNKDESDAGEPSVNKKNKILNNKKRQCPDTPTNITDDEQEKSSSTLSNSLSRSYDRKNKKKKKEEIDVNEVKEIDMNYDIEIEKKEKPKSKDNINKEKFIENTNDNYIIINDNKDAEENNKDISGIKVLRINYMSIPENPEDGISFNIKFKKKRKTFIETFNTKNDIIPKECLAKYYEMFIRENFKGCVFSKEMLFE